VCVCVCVWGSVRGLEREGGGGGVEIVNKTYIKV